MDKWTRVAGMNKRRAGAGVAVINNVLYVVGGSPDHKNSHKSCEKYDVETNTWEFIASK